MKEQYEDMKSYRMNSEAISLHESASSGFGSIGKRFPRRKAFLIMRLVYGEIPFAIRKCVIQNVQFEQQAFQVN